MKNIILFLLFSFFSFEAGTQTILKVSQTPGEGDFTELQSAINSATPGSILMIYPGSYSGNVTLDKQLKLIGTGYEFVTNYPEIQTFINPSYIGGELTLSGPDANNSIIKGLEIHTLNIQSATNVIIENALVKRGTISNGVNIYFKKCYIGGAFYTGVSSSNSNIRFEGNNYLYFKNTLFNDPFYYSGNNETSLFFCLTGKDGNSGYLELDNCIFKNNIRIAGYGPTSNNYSNTTFVLKNSIGITGLGFPVLINNSAPSFILNNFFEVGNSWGGNNIGNINPVDYFVGYPTQDSYTFDNRYQLKSTAPAKNAASHGGDCGIYGGDEPYKPGGLPDIPLIYELNVPPNAGGNVNINIKVRSEN